MHVSALRGSKLRSSTNRDKGRPSSAPTNSQSGALAPTSKSECRVVSPFCEDIIKKTSFITSVAPKRSGCTLMMKSLHITRPRLQIMIPLGVNDSKSFSPYAINPRLMWEHPFPAPSSASRRFLPTTKERRRASPPPPPSRCASTLPPFQNAEQPSQNKTIKVWGCVLMWQPAARRLG